MDAVLIPGAGDPPEPRGDAFALVDAEGLVVSWSAGAQRLLGYAAQEVQGRRAAGLLWSETGAEQLAERFLTGPSGLLGPARLRSRDGDEVAAVLWLHQLGPVAGEGQWLIQAAEAADVQEADLRLALLRGLFTESPLIIDVFDAELRLLAQNTSQCRVPGFGQEAAGRTLREAVPPGLMDIEAVERRQRKVLATGRALIGTQVHGRDPLNPDLEAAWSETILPLRGGSGRTVGLAHMVADITAEARARGRLAMVNDAGIAIGSLLDVQHTAQELTDFAVPRFADCAYVDLLDPVRSGAEPAPGTSAPPVVLRRAAVSMAARGGESATVAPGQIDQLASRPDSPAARALADRRPVLLSGDALYDEYPATGERGEALRRSGVHSLLLVPMHARGTALGTVVFARFHPTRLFEADDVLLAQEFVARAAACIDNAARYTAERTTAQSLQRSLLPSYLPELATVEAAARYVPAPGSTLLGGAWFDVIPLAGARVALAAGDTGKQGLQAAVSMGRLRTAVRTLADLDMPPEELLSHLADLVKRAAVYRGDTPTKATCVYAVFDPLSRRCTVAGAGHPMPALVRASGEVEFPDLPPGPDLDLQGPPYESCELTLSDGDRLVLCTAGLLSPGSEDAGADGTGQAVHRLREALSHPGTAAQPPTPDRGSDQDPKQELEAACDALLHRLHSPDRTGDAALLVARLRGLRADHHATWKVAADPEAVGRARSLVGRKLSEWHLEEQEFTTQLLVSELLTNAVRYGEPPIRLRLIRDRNLICEVSDGSSTSPLVRRALETDEGGRGLYMVTQLAGFWGTRYHARGKSVWAEQPLLPLPP
ncbi:SpoIIE family protein phosphatase [Peterkaempfera sp. SMS 1(5)a]|uniref:SpoIIE family protein phosphatase n=1 Tax=Peterkaempfera podocarpi TaxID=3232308 RepID=UPI003670FE3F